MKNCWSDSRHKGEQAIPQMMPLQSSSSSHKWEENKMIVVLLVLFEAITLIWRVPVESEGKDRNKNPTIPISLSPPDGTTAEVVTPDVLPYITLCIFSLCWEWDHPDGSPVSILHSPKVTSLLSKSWHGFVEQQWALPRLNSIFFTAKV